MFLFLCQHNDIALVVVYEIASYLRPVKVDLQFIITAHMLFKNLAFLIIFITLFLVCFMIMCKAKFSVHGELLQSSCQSCAGVSVIELSYYGLWYVYSS